MELRRSVLLPYPVEPMFDLIEQAENYPSFLPWCNAATILERSDDWVAARIEFKYLQVRFTLQTRNPKHRPEWLKVRLVQGPFRKFEGDWLLTPLGAQGCRIDFRLAYEVAEGLLDKIAGRAAEMVARSMMDAFVKRAEETLQPIWAQPVAAANAPSIDAPVADVPAAAGEASGSTKVTEPMAPITPITPIAPMTSIAPIAPMAPMTPLASTAPASPLRPTDAPASTAPAAAPAASNGPAGDAAATPRDAAAPTPPSLPQVDPAPPPAATRPTLESPSPRSPADPAAEPASTPEADPAVLAAVRDSALAADLTPTQIAVLAAAMRLEDYTARQVVAPEGSSDDRLCVVVAGKLAVIKQFGAPEESLLVTLNPGDFAHELGFLDGAERYASLVAASQAQVLILERQALERLIDVDPWIQYRVMCAIVRTVHRIQTRLSVQASELTNYIVKQHGRY